MALASSAWAIQSIACVGSGSRACRRQIGAVEPGLAVHVGRDVALADQRPRRAGGDRDVGAADVVEDADRVRGGLLERLVAGHGGHAEQIDLGAGERQQQRDRVVVAGIAVEDDVGHALRIACSVVSSQAVP